MPGTFVKLYFQAAEIVSIAISFRDDCDYP